MKRYDPNKPGEAAVMDRLEVRAFDKWAIEEMGIPGVVLMENAGMGCVRVIMDRLRGVDEPAVCIFCGAGNNGGDGYVIARGLVNAGVGVKVVLCADREKIAGDALVNLEIIEKMGVAIERLVIDADAAGKVGGIAGGCNLIVDAIFGTGLAGAMRGDWPGVIEAVNGTGIDVVAVDIPSGLDCDTGEAVTGAIKAQATVTFVAAKQGFAVNPAARNYTGYIYVAGIGIDARCKF